MFGDYVTSVFQTIFNKTKVALWFSVSQLRLSCMSNQTTIIKLFLNCRVICCIIHNNQSVLSCSNEPIFVQKPVLIWNFFCSTLNLIQLVDVVQGKLLCDQLGTKVSLDRTLTSFCSSDFNVIIAKSNLRGEAEQLVLCCRAVNNERLLSSTEPNCSCVALTGFLENG